MDPLRDHARIGVRLASTTVEGEKSETQRDGAQTGAIAHGGTQQREGGTTEGGQKKKRPSGACGRPIFVYVAVVGAFCGNERVEVGDGVDVPFLRAPRSGRW